MDVTSLVIPPVISVVVNFLILVVFYSKWILPYLTRLQESLPARVRESTEPFINEKIGEFTERLDSSIVELKGSFKATSSRLNRTMKQADDFLQGLDIDPDDEEQVSEARTKLVNRYGENVAINAITNLFASIAQNQNAKAAQNAAIEARSTDGWD